MRWLNDAHVAEGARIAFPDDIETKSDRNIARWLSKNICVFLHPDQYVSDPKKQTLMRNLSVLANKVVAKLKNLN